MPTSSSKFHDKARTNEIMTIIMVAAAGAAAFTASLSASDIRYWNVLHVPTDGKFTRRTLYLRSCSERKKSIDSIYLLVVTKDEGIGVIDAELEPEIQRWDCYCGYRWTRCY